MLHHPVLEPLAGDGQAMKLAREADRKIADIDHLLDLAEPLGQHLADFDADQLPEIALVGAQLLAE